MTINDYIVDEARIYIGRKEKPGNAGFESPGFEKVLMRMGWKPGQSWCDFFAELAWKGGYTRAGKPEIATGLSMIFTGGAGATYNNFRANGWTTTKEPVKGALAVFKVGGSWHGHIGIVTEVQAGFVKTIEGNTSEAGSREGTTVLEKNRKLIFDVTPGKLNLHGFVHPK